VQYRAITVPLCLFASALTLSSCGDNGNEITTTSPFIEWRYTSDIPYSGAAATIHHYHARVTARGVLVLEAIKHSKPESMTFRLVGVSSSGRVTSKIALTKRPGFSIGFPLHLSGNGRRFYVALYDSRMSADGGSRASILNVNLSTQETSEVAGSDIGGFPKGAFRSRDGRTIFAGAEDSRLWLAALDPAGKPLWRYYYDDRETKALVKRPAVEKALQGRNFYQGRFLKDGTFALYSSGPEFAKSGVTHLAYELRIDPSGKALKWTSLFDLRDSDLSRPASGLGRVRAQIMGMRRLSGGGLVVVMRGWLRGEYGRMRVAKVGTNGRMEWVVTLVPGNEGEPVDIAVGRGGEIVGVGTLRYDKDTPIQSLFRLSADGKIVASYTVRGMSIQRIRAHPDGGYLLWAVTKESGGKERLNLLRIRKWSKD